MQLLFNFRQMCGKAVGSVYSLKRRRPNEQGDTEKMLYSGVSPMELLKYSVISGADKTDHGIYTELVINNPDTGTLTPAQYRVIADKTNQGIRLSSCALCRAAEYLSEDSENKKWISFYLPARALMFSHLRKMLESERRGGGYDLSRLVIEIPADILYEDAGQITETVNGLKSEFGVRFLLSGFCDEYCPILRLPRYPVDFVLLDSSVDTAEVYKRVLGAVSIAKQSGKAVIVRIRNPFDGLASDAPDYYISDIPVSERRER